MSKRLIKKALALFSVVPSGENAATKSSHRPKLTVCGNFYLYRQKKWRRKAPSGRELAPKATEGECVTMKLGGTESSAGSFHHFVVPLPLGGRL